MQQDPLNADAEIRLATTHDAETIFSVHRDSVESLCRSSYSPQQIAMWLEGRSSASYQAAIANKRIFVAALANEVVGFIEVAPGEIVKLFVKRAVAGRGVGDKLMHIGLAEAGKGSGTIRIESTRNAVSFYARHGFQRVGEGLFSRSGSKVSIEIVKLLSEGDEVPEDGGG